MTEDDKTVGSFLHRLLDLFEEGAQNPGRRRYEKYSSKQSEENFEEKIYLCQECDFMETDEAEMNEHIKESHETGAYERKEAKPIGSSDVEPFQRDGSNEGEGWQEPERKMPELEKEERKKMVKDWFNDHCENAPTIPGVGEKVFGLDKEIKSGDSEYNMLFSILDELREQGFLEVGKDGARNRYYSDKKQLQLKR